MLLTACAEKQNEKSKGDEGKRGPMRSSARFRGWSAPIVSEQAGRSSTYWLALYSEVGHRKGGGVMEVTRLEAPCDLDRAAPDTRPPIHSDKGDYISFRG